MSYECRVEELEVYLTHDGADPAWSMGFYLVYLLTKYSGQRLCVSDDVLEVFLS